MNRHQLLDWLPCSTVRRTGRARTPRPRWCFARPRLEVLEDRVLLSSTANIAMTFATTTDARTVSVAYTINGGSLAGQNVSFNIYRSAAFDSLGGAQLIGTATVPGSDSADLSAGSHAGVR